MRREIVKTRHHEEKKTIIEVYVAASDEIEWSRINHQEERASWGAEKNVEVDLRDQDSHTKTSHHEEGGHSMSQDEMTSKKKQITNSRSCGRSNVGDAPEELSLAGNHKKSDNEILASHSRWYARDKARSQGLRLILIQA